MSSLKIKLILNLKGFGAFRFIFTSISFTDVSSMAKRNQNVNSAIKVQVLPHFRYLALKPLKISTHFIYTIHHQCLQFPCCFCEYTKLFPSVLKEIPFVTPCVSEGVGKDLIKFTFLVLHITLCKHIRALRA